MEKSVSHPTRQKYDRLWSTSGKPPRVWCGNSTLPENLPDVGITTTTYRKLKLLSPSEILLNRGTIVRFPIRGRFPLGCKIHRMLLSGGCMGARSPGSVVFG